MTARAALYRLVYGRWGFGSDNESDLTEPLIAVVVAEEEACAIESDVTARFPGAQVSWEELTLSDDEGVRHEDGDLHIVMSGFSPLFPGMPDRPLEMTDPLGVAIYSTRACADRHAYELNRSSSPEHVVYSVPADYRRPGWPFHDFDSEEVSDLVPFDTVVGGAPYLSGQPRGTRYVG